MTTPTTSPPEPDLGLACIGYVDMPDGSTAPGCPDEPRWFVETTCDAGEDFDGPCCESHMHAVLLGPAKDFNGHRVYLISMVQVAERGA